MKGFILLFIFLFSTIPLDISAQGKRDHKWVMGYDTSLLVPGGDAILLDFDESPVAISNITTVHNFHMEGSNTSMCDEDGNLLFYSNGCYIVDASNEIMVNGDSINPGLIQDMWCDGGGSPIPQGVLALPVPKSDSLFYVFNLDMDIPYIASDTFIGIAPQRLYYHVIDITGGSGLGEVVLKNQIAVQDTFARGNIQATRHANGKDWWLIVPKSHSNCYFVVLIDEEGLHPPNLECEGNIWNDKDNQGQAVFSPGGGRYIRFNAWNGLNIFDFDNGTGALSNHVGLHFENEDFYHVAGVAVSPNSRYLYASGLWRVYQYDLFADDMEASKVLVAEWDGFEDPFPTIFYLAALAPDGKIYISSTSSHRSLHVIHKPDCPGASCDFEQHGVPLPSYNFATIPNLPHYRSVPSGIECDSVINSAVPFRSEFSIQVYPNPTSRTVNFDLSELVSNAKITIYDLTGKKRISSVLRNKDNTVDLSQIETGMYLYEIRLANDRSINGKLIKKK